MNRARPKHPWSSPPAIAVSWEIGARLTQLSTGGRKAGRRRGDPVPSEVRRGLPAVAATRLPEARLPEARLPASRGLGRYSLTFTANQSTLIPAPDVMSAEGEVQPQTLSG